MGAGHADSLIRLQDCWAYTGFSQGCRETLGVFFGRSPKDTANVAFYAGREADEDTPFWLLLFFLTGVTGQLWGSYEYVLASHRMRQKIWGLLYKYPTERILSDYRGHEAIPKPSAIRAW